MQITKPSITRLARRAGSKTISEDCYDLVRAYVGQNLDTIIQKALVVNSGRQTKTLMSDDVYDALSLMDVNLTRSSDLGTTVVTGKTKVKKEETEKTGKKKE